MPAPMPPVRCPIFAPACPEPRTCHPALPPPGAERAAILVLRFIAAARDTGDACCWDAALDEAEAAFGGRRAPLVLGHAGALIRRLACAGADIDFLPPPCRRLSAGETLLLGALRTRPPAIPRLDVGVAMEDVAALAQNVAAADALRPQQAA